MWNGCGVSTVDTCVPRASARRSSIRNATSFYCCAVSSKLSMLYCRTLHMGTSQPFTPPLYSETVHLFVFAQPCVYRSQSHVCAPFRASGRRPWLDAISIISQLRIQLQRRRVPADKLVCITSIQFFSMILFLWILIPIIQISPRCTTQAILNMKVCHLQIDSFYTRMHH